ncbi:MAG: hypothetical protein JW982_00105, partial [Spirochaetes bacterium]|nr:hypothetical protein [Spirochaetota bacterium]
MADNLENLAFDEQSKKLNLVMQFTGGDQEKAKAMIGGQYNDIRAVKSRFSIRSADLFGAFLLFLKPDNKSVSNVTLKIFNDEQVYQKLKINDVWDLYYKTLSDLGDVTAVNESNDVSEHIANSAEGYDLFSYVENNDESGLQSVLIEIFKKFYNLPDIECQSEIENTNSLKLNEKNIPILSIERAKKAIKMQNSQKKSVLESQYQLIMNAKIIVSPVKGKYINDLAPGDMIKCLPLKNDALALKIASAQKALTAENEIKPLRAKFKERVQLEEGGC